MLEGPLVCKNKDCKGRDFEHAGGIKWKCVYCGTIIELKQKTIKRKIRPKKDPTPEREYNPLTFICEQCGATIETITHPREEKKLNTLWSQHTCSKQSNLYT